MNEQAQSVGGRTEPLTVSVQEAAKLLGVSRGVAYQSVKSGEIPAIRLGKCWRIPRASLLKMVGPIQ
jgi:excisionase family DNA binding protein